MTSTIMGPLGTAVSEVTAVKAIVEAGGPAAIAIKAGIGAGTNVTSDSGAKVISRPCKIHFTPAPSADLGFAVG